jgi:hypothetical protein
MSNFHECLAFGQKYEEYAKERIKSLYANSKIIREQDETNYKNFHADFEIETSDGQTLSFEVKADRWALKMNSFFIEFKCYGKPSGIRISTATYHILSNTKEFYLIKTEKLHTILLENDFTIKSCKTSFGFIVPKRIIIEYAILI